MNFLRIADYGAVNMIPPLAGVLEQEEEELEPENPAPNPSFVIRSKETGLCVELEVSPVAVTTRDVFCRVSHKQKKSFATWTKQERHEAARRLHSIFPSDTHFAHIDTHLLNKIYKLIATHQQTLCTQQITYPALLKGTIKDPRNKDSSLSFELEVHSVAKMLLLFHDAKMIDEGSFKEWRRGYSLHKPKITAYSRLKSDVKQDPKIIEREEHYLKQFSNCSYVGKVYRIFYYLFSGKKEPQQVIEMRYYPQCFFTLASDCLQHPQGLQGQGDCQKIAYSVQLLEGVAQLHQKKTLHRDIKLENLLLDERARLYLIDFGLACQLDDKEALKKKCGSLFYAAPELLTQRDFPVGPGVDVWASGCILWILLTEQCYPWYDVLKKLHEQGEKFGVYPEALFTELNDALLAYDTKRPSPEKKLSYLFWNMFRYHPVDRWSAQQVIDYLDQHFSPGGLVLRELSLVERFKLETRRAAVKSPNAIQVTLSPQQLPPPETKRRPRHFLFLAPSIPKK